MQAHLVTQFGDLKLAIVSTRVQACIYSVDEITNTVSAIPLNDAIAWNEPGIVMLDDN